MKKRFVTLVLAGVIALSLGACGTSSGASGNSAKEAGNNQISESSGEKMEIAFVCPITAGDTNWNNAFAGMQDACKEVGYSVQMVGPASLDLEQWVKDMDSAIASGYDMLITTAVSDVIVPTISKAVSGGIPVCLIDTDSEESGRFAYVGLDNYQLGIALADQVAELAEGAEIKVCFEGMSLTGSNFIDRMDGFKDTIAEEYSNIEVVTEQEAADASTAADVTGQVMNGFPEVNCFVGLDGTAPKGIAQSLLEKGVEDSYYSVALSIDHQVLDYIRDGGIDAGVGLDYYTQGYQAVMNCYAQANGDAFEEVIIPDAIPVYSENADEYAKSVGLE